MTRDAKPETAGPPPGREGPRDASHPEAGHPGARAQQARDRHDFGGYGDKISMPDPAASPLGTDSEAAGLRQPEGSLEPESAAAAGNPPNTSTGVPHGHARGEYERGSGRWIWMAAAASVALLLGLMVFIIAAF